MKAPPTIITVINNFTDYDVYLEMLEVAGHAGGLPLVEILWDNYAHLDPAAVCRALRPLGRRVALHSMSVAFLDGTDEEFARFAELASAHVAAMKPLYVSEHCCTYRAGSVNLAAPAELDWPAQLDRLCDRVARYQDALGMQVLLENYGSMHAAGRRQVEHFAALVERTGCGVLFDISNAVLAEANGVAPFAAWLELLAGARRVRCHVGGYSRDPVLGLFEDSHAFDLSAATHEAVARTLRSLDVASVCYERSHNLDAAAMGRELRALEALAREICDDDEPTAPGRARASRAAELPG